MTNTPNELQDFLILCLCRDRNRKSGNEGIDIKLGLEYSVSLLRNILSAQQAATEIQTPRRRNITALFYKNSKKTQRANQETELQISQGWYL